MSDSLDKAKNLMQDFLNKHHDIYEKVRTENLLDNNIAGELDSESDETLNEQQDLSLDNESVNVRNSQNSLSEFSNGLIQPEGSSVDNFIDYSSDDENEEDKKFFRLKKQLESIPIYNQARQYGINYLSSITQTTGKFSEKLISKGYPEKLVKFLVWEFTRDGLLDDYAVAGLIIDTFRGARAESPYAMRRRLLSRGVSPDIVEQIIEDEYSDTDLLLSEFMSERCKSELDNLDKCKDKIEGRKIISKIVRRGQARMFYQADILNYLRNRKNGRDDT